MQGPCSKCFLSILTRGMIQLLSLRYSTLVTILISSNLHNDLPLAPEKLSSKQSWLSPFAKTFGVKLWSDAPRKVIERLFDKHNYVCHYRNLKFYLNHGLNVKPLHGVLQFSQNKWLGDYISKNTVMRKQTGIYFEKNSTNS